MSEKVPEGWASAPLGDLIELRYGKGLPEKSRRPGRFAVFGSNGVVGQHSAAVTRGPAILVGRKGSVGAVHYSAEPCWPIDTTYFVDAFGPFEPKYLTYLLRAIDLSQDESSTAIPGLSREDAYRRSGLVAPLAEQRRIIEKVEELLARANATRDHFTKVPAILRRFRQSVLAAACSGRLTEDWRENNLPAIPASSLVVDSETNDLPDADEHLRDVPVPSGWATARVDALVSVQNGRAFPSKAYRDSGIRLLRPGNLHASGYLQWTNENTVQLPPPWGDKFPEFVLGADELLMNLTAQSLKDEFLGRVCLKQDHEPALLNQRLARFRNLGNFDLRPYLFLYFRARFFREFVSGLDTGSLIRHMHSKDVERHVVLLPPPDEQLEIVRRAGTLFSFADTVERRVATAAARVERLPHSILAKAFRGELVPTDAELARAEGRDYETAEMLLERVQRETTREHGNRLPARRSRARSRPACAESDLQE